MALRWAFNEPDQSPHHIRYHFNRPCNCIYHYNSRNTLAHLLRKDDDTKHETPPDKNLHDLVDKSLTNQGDLAWDLDYATAYAYQHIIAARTGITDTIDRIRALGDDKVSNKTPYFIFSHLDRAIFSGRLQGMVYLRWRDMATSAPGTTFAPDKGRGSRCDEKVPRVCIELNCQPFQEEDGGQDVAGLDELLDAMIHQMIHAWFLVCCGAQEGGAKQDGRLSDGLHFGVLLFTLRDITRKCNRGPLRLPFYAVQRCWMYDGHTRTRHGYYDYRGALDRDEYISIDPKGVAVDLPPADGESHCMYDNRKVRYAQIKDWQVETYTKAIKADLEGKGGYEIFDLNTNGELEAVKRLEGPPSRTYVELVWDKKLIMIPRDKVKKLGSLKKLVEKEGGMRTLKCPSCSFKILKFLYDFIQKGEYHAFDSNLQSEHRNGPQSSRGPPVIKGSPPGNDPEQKLTTQVLVFKLAQEMEFDELREYALQHLHDMPFTTDDPSQALKEIYDGGKKGSHSSLQHWCRHFLLQKEYIRHGYVQRSGDQSPQSPSYYQYEPRSSMLDRQESSNLEKLVSWYPDQVQELWDVSAAFRDDFNLAYNTLLAGGHYLQGQYRPAAAPYHSINHLPPLPVVTTPIAIAESPSPFLIPQVELTTPPFLQAPIEADDGAGEWASSRISHHRYQPCLVNGIERRYRFPTQHRYGDRLPLFMGEGPQSRLKRLMDRHEW